VVQDIALIASKVCSTALSVLAQSLLWMSNLSIDLSRIAEMLDYSHHEKNISQLGRYKA
jgi:hypothetical protein